VASTVVNVKFPEFTLHPGQQAFIECRAPEAAYVGGVGAGKSVALIVRAVLLAHQFPGNAILIARKSYRELSDTTKVTFAQVVPPALVAGENKKDDLTHIRAVGGGTSTIFWRSYEDSPTDWQKFRSMEFGAVFLDEASEAAQGVTDILATRLRTRVPYRSMNYVSNPVPEDHWIYQQFVKSRDPDRVYFKGTTYENRDNLPPGYIERLEKRLSPEKARILLGGEFGHIPDGLPVFTPFAPTMDGKPWHVREGLEPVPGHPILRGWDFGVVRPACVWMQWTGGVKRILREKMGYNISTREFGTLIRDLSTEMFPGFSFLDYCDPAGFSRDVGSAKAPVDELRPLGIRPYHLRRTQPGFRAGLIMDSLLRTAHEDDETIPEFQLDRQCPILVGAMAGGYRRQEVIPDQPIDDEPVKDGYFEHPIDALGFVYVGRSTMGQSKQLGREKVRENQRRLAMSYG